MTAADEKCSSERVRQYSLMKKSFAQQTQVTRQVVFEYSLLACEFFFTHLPYKVVLALFTAKKKRLDESSPRCCSSATDVISASQMKDLLLMMIIFPY